MNNRQTSHFNSFNLEILSITAEPIWGSSKTSKQWSVKGSSPDPRFCDNIQLDRLVDAFSLTPFLRDSKQRGGQKSNLEHVGRTEAASQKSWYFYLPETLIDRQCFSALSWKLPTGYPNTFSHNFIAAQVFDPHWIACWQYEEGSVQEKSLWQSPPPAALPNLARVPSSHQPGSPDCELGGIFYLWEKTAQTWLHHLGVLHLYVLHTSSW